MKTEKQFNLSEKNKRYLDMWLYSEEDVKEAVRLLQQGLFEICVNKEHKDRLYLNDDVQEEIIKIFGEELTK